MVNRIPVGLLFFFGELRAPQKPESTLFILLDTPVGIF